MYSKMSDTSIRVRRAVLGDYEAVLDINRHVYAGFDYVPALYYTYFHDNKHVIYVLEQEGQLISLVNYEISSDGSHVTTMSSRVRPSHQGRGLSVEKSGELRDIFSKDFPNVTHELFAVVVTAGAGKKIAQSTTLFHWKTAGYQTRIGDILSQLHAAKTNSRYSVIDLSYSTCIDWIYNNDVFQTFLRQYTTEYIPAGSAWRLVRANNKDELKSVFAVSRVFVTPKDNQSEGETAKIKALSFSSLLCVEIGCRADMYYYGGITDLCDHVTAHLLHIGSVCGNQNVGFLLHYVSSLQCQEVERCVTELGLTRDKVEPFFDRIESILGIKKL